MSAAEAKAEIRAGAAVVGGEEELAKRPVFSVIQCPICPLSFEKGSVEAVMEFARAGIPVVSMSMALCGLTSPVTLASTIAIVNAENIASFAVSQMTKTGAPVVYSSESTVMNMKTGEIRYGSLEEVLIASALGQMARHYEVPSMVGSFGAGLRGDSPGVNVDPSELIFSAMTNLSLTDFTSGLGGLDQAKGSSLEQLVIDADIWESIKDIRKDVSFDEEHYALDVIRAAGPGGSFLSAPHTLRNMRKELFLPSSEKARVYDMYRLDKEPAEIVRYARERATSILESHTPEPLEREVKCEVESIVKDFSSG
jgi:trimethylamine--corrinoid protein Co-methyltransferase